MKLNDLLKQEKPEEYDMKLDYAGGQLAAFTDPAERFMIYKASAQKGSVYLKADALGVEIRRSSPDLEHFDCDRCGLMKQVYKTLWRDPIENMEDSRISGESGDTMTSFQTLLNLAIRQFDAERPFAVKRQGCYSQSYCAALYAADRTGLLGRLDAFPGLRDFAAAVHTVGNFLPVPPGFNQARAGWPEKDGSLENWHDYWDLTLTKIWEWYALGGGPEAREVLVRLLHCEWDVRECERWLTYFRSWDRFVAENYLQDFVDENGIPIPFCAGHTWVKPVPGDLGAFFAAAAELILKRGRRMTAALREAV